MIESLASPAVIVVDDEEQDYGPILRALSTMHVQCVHYKGDDVDELPSKPFSSARLVFMDLHLSAGIHKDAASRAANVFRRIVSSSAPSVIVVIWSKYAQETDSTIPKEDQETEAELFQRTLLEAESGYRDRLIFLTMAKPKGVERPETVVWTEQLKTEIAKTVSDRRSIDLLWTWEALLREAATQVSEGLSSLTARAVGEKELDVEQRMRTVLRSLAGAQGEGDWSESSAPLHLVAVLDELLADQVQHGKEIEKLGKHGSWLFEAPPETFLTQAAKATINGFLLTAAVQADGQKLLPGTVYRCDDVSEFLKAFGIQKIGSLLYECCNPIVSAGEKAKEEARAIREQWREAAIPILLEISPDCDVAQNKRPMASLLGGLALPMSLAGHANRGGAFHAFPDVMLRRLDDLGGSDAWGLLFCSRYRLSIPSSAAPAWANPWFRLREMPTASARNWCAGQSARVGYVSLR
ncbi:MAG: hypothetical protein JWL61_3930 [Gemmatimonadetes bacterium]|nr:hypothetical protein [Gemmatimonadota bacterium]